MASKDKAGVQEAKSKKGGHGDGNRQQSKQDSLLERYKTVVRRLPPNLPEDVFWESVKPWVSPETVAWKIFYAGKVRKRNLNKENLDARAYIAFKNDDYLANFSRDYDGHIFRDKHGNESQAVVEYAPFQKVPPEKVRPDTKYRDTIDQDEDYVSFLESLKAVQRLTEADTLEAFASAPAVDRTKTTPLLESLKATKAAAKEAAAARQQEKKAAEDAKAPARKPGPSSQPSVTIHARSVDESSSKARGSKKAAKVAAAMPSSSKDAVAASPPKIVIVKNPQSARAKDAREPKDQPTQNKPRPIKPSARVAESPAAAGPAPKHAQDAAPKPERKKPAFAAPARQLEVALSGVGVPAGSRRARKEKEGERGKRPEDAVTAQDGRPGNVEKPAGGAESRGPAGPSVLTRPEAVAQALAAAQKGAARAARQDNHAATADPRAEPAQSAVKSVKARGGRRGGGGAVPAAAPLPPG